MNYPKQFKYFTFLLMLLLIACSFISENQEKNIAQEIVVGAERTELYFPLLENKRIAVVANQTSIINNTHLVDSLVNSGFNVVKVFGPEHGFRGSVGAGVKVKDNIDVKTGIPIVSLYGSHRKPTSEDLVGVDLVVFDIQDVGARFYTYISTMTYVMEACSENNVDVMILDRPNPHGDYVDGPLLENEYSSFVGLHQVPVVHGMTVGEYAKMVNAEGWLYKGVKCKLEIIKMENYTHLSRYELPIAPSPNLPNATAIDLYPSLCFFEGTIISVGRGTDFPFQVIGHPDFGLGSFVFTPEDIPGKAVNPKYEGEACYGQSLKNYAENEIKNDRRLHLSWLINYFNYFKDRKEFFNGFFKKLAGNETLQKQIENDMTEEMIRESWKKDIIEFKQFRKKYLLYADFE